MATSNQGGSSSVRNRDIDVSDLLEHREGADIVLDTWPDAEPAINRMSTKDMPDPEPVFQQVSEHDSEYWVLRWNEPRMLEDPVEEAGRLFRKLADQMGFGYGSRESASSADISVLGQESELGYFEGPQIRDANGALKIGFSLEEVLEKQSFGRMREKPEMLRAVDPYRQRIYSFELDEEEEIVLAGIQGYSQFNDWDWNIFPSGYDEEVDRYLREETASYEDWRE